MTNPIVFRIPPTPLVDANGRLTPEWLVLINRLAGMGDQVVSVDLAALLLIVERVQLAADAAQATATQALNRPMPDVLGLVGVPSSAPNDTLSMVSVSSQSVDFLPMV